jgi:hypothetical protein
MIVVRFVGIRSFLIRYSDGHSKLTYRQLKKFLDCVLQNIIPSIKEISKLQSSHYRNVSMDPLRTGRASLGIRGARFGNRYSIANTPAWRH